MAKLDRRDYKLIVLNTIRGKSRQEIAMHMPISSSRVSRIVNDIAKGKETQAVRDALGDCLTDDTRMRLKDQLQPRVSLREQFDGLVEKLATNDRERRLMLAGFNFGCEKAYRQFSAEKRKLTNKKK